MRAYLVFIFVLCLLVSPHKETNAQTSPRTIEDRVENNTPLPTISQNNPAKFYDEKLLILKKVKLFKTYISSALQFTDNALLQQSNKQSDLITSLTSGIDLNATIKKKVNVSAGLTASRVDYKNNSALGYNSIQGNTALSYKYKDWIGSISYTPTVVLEKNFSNRSVTLHRFSAIAARNKIYWSRFLLSSYSAAHYVRSNPIEFSNTQFDTGVRAIYPITKKLRLAINPHVYQKSYHDFFEEKTGQQRSDLGFRINSNLSYSPNDNMDLSLSINYTRIDTAIKTTLKNRQKAISNNPIAT